MALMTPADYARHRGCSKSAVTQAQKQRIKAAEVVQDGRVWIDAQYADRLWSVNSRRRRSFKAEPAQAAAPRPEVRPKDPPKSPPKDKDLRAYIMSLPEDEIPEDVNESIKRREHYNAERQKVHALKDRGEVVPVLEVKKAAQELGQALRENVMGVPNRISGMLAATTDAGEVTRLLEDELRSALRVLEATTNE